MKRYIEFDDVLEAPLEIMGWLLDATVRVIVEAPVETEYFAAHGPTGDLRNYSTSSLGEPEINSLHFQALYVVNEHNHDMRLEITHPPAGMREKFKRAVEARAIERAKQVPDNKWKEEEFE